VAWNKLWRRTFWDAHAFRFPEGVLYEDTPVTIPAHFLAKSVDVVSEPVYYWRARVGTDKSITQRRTQVKALTDRLQTIQSARDFLRSYPDEQARVWYDASILGDDLAPYLDLLRKGDDEFRQVFLDRVNAMLDDADPSIYDGLPGDLRRRWLLVRERDLDALLRLPPAAQQRRGPAPAGPKPKQPPTPSVARRVVRRVPRRVRRIVPVRLRRRLLGVMRGRRS
jgi:CDP-glycerol glycerophosphotransferase